MKAGEVYAAKNLPEPGAAPKGGDASQLSQERPDTNVAPEAAPPVELNATGGAPDIGRTLLTPGEAEGGNQENTIRAVLFGLAALNSRGNMAEAFAEGLGAVGAAYEVHRKRKLDESAMQTQAERVQVEKDRLRLEETRAEAELSLKAKDSSQMYALAKSDRLLGAETLLTNRQNLAFMAGDKSLNTWLNFFDATEKFKAEAARSGMDKNKLRVELARMGADTQRLAGKDYINSLQDAYDSATARISANAEAKFKGAVTDRDRDNVAAGLIKEAYNTWSVGSMYNTDKRPFVQAFSMDMLPAIQQSPVLRGMFENLTEEQIAALFPKTLAPEESKGLARRVYEYLTGANDTANAGAVTERYEVGSNYKTMVGKEVTGKNSQQKYVITEEGGKYYATPLTIAEPGKQPKRATAPAPTPKPTAKSTGRRAYDADILESQEPAALPITQPGKEVMGGKTVSIEIPTETLRAIGAQFEGAITVQGLKAQFDELSAKQQQNLAVRNLYNQRWLALQTPKQSIESMVPK